MDNNNTEGSALYSRYNFDDVFNRVVIVGLLDLMNNKIVYDQVWEDDVIEKVTLPTMYDFAQSGDERFAQDNYTFFGNTCFGTHKITGKFDMFPRCVISLNSTKIDSGNITNRFVKGKYMTQEGGKLVTYQTFLYSIPMTFSFNCTVWASNIIEAFKIEQSIREQFYKNKTYNVLYRGMKLSCCAGFPEEVSSDKTVSYSFEQDKTIKLTFPVAVECYQPVFDESMKMDANTRIEHIAMDISHTPTGTVMPKRKVSVHLHGIDRSTAYPAGTSIALSWDYNSNVSEVCDLALCYIDEDGKEYMIDRSLENTGSFIWNIPIALSNFVEPNISYVDDEHGRSNIVNAPSFRIVPDSSNRITEESFILVDAGDVNITDGTIPMFIDYLDDKGKLVSSGNYFLNVVNGMVDVNRPVILMNGVEPMKYTKSYKKRKISIKLFYPFDESVSSKIDNILII